MPTDAPAAKIAATQGYGAEVIFYERATMNRAEIAAAIARERGATLVPPYDDPDVIAGQGTAALELLQDAGSLDALLVPVGGGGLLSGSALAATALAAADCDLRRRACSRRRLCALVRSEKHRIEIAVPATIADGQQTTSPGELTFPIVLRLCAGFFTVSDDEIRDAMRFAFERLKLVVEPSGASALAALLSGKGEFAGLRVGVILSGGNVDAGRYGILISPEALDLRSSTGQQVEDQENDGDHEQDVN